MVNADDEVFAITSAGGVIRTRAGEIKQSGRQTMGVRLMNLASGDSVVALARNAESLEADGDPADVDGELAEETPSETADTSDLGDLDPDGSVREEGPLALTTRPDRTPEAKKNSRPAYLISPKPGMSRPVSA